MTTVKKSVAVLGLGSMGTALADALLVAGHEVTVWNRTPGRVEGFVARGARRAESVAEAVTAGEIVIVCILDYGDIGPLLEQQGVGRAALQGRVVVNVTNGSPEEARAMAERVTGLGASYLDGGIMAVPEIIASPEAFVLYSGSREAFEAHRGVLDAFARSVYLGEDPGLAPLHDLALLSGMYGMFGGFLHAAALVRSAGGSVAEFTTTLLQPWLAAMAGGLPAMAAQIDSGDYSVTGSPLAMQVAHDSIGEVSRAQGVSPELYAPLFALMERRVADGHGSEGLAGVVELVHPR
ncbi:NAD(P)-binding domain-containing protein [Streptomyces sp. NEAU-S7GS2]|uniref:NAD(P)-dependent oxidoreductase n=1 Tax=Streptomyces sp. NEAU-S7GS2 TaxID=2202000 RepID=UPI000D6EF5AD|nr:NAD(P)-binding domain-containing protein [Streptomyces sp. NEAU-S7GS2]AWN27754.1 6-phosphogluconate dehydrogenase [Streptomyces sp. NEAU-S7GS2]